MKMSQGERIKRGNAGQFRVASELCRRGYSAAITLGNAPNVDILCSSDDGSKSICIQVKTFRLGAHKCPLTIAAERISREDFFWVFLGLDDQLSEAERPAEFYVLPASELAPEVFKGHRSWLAEKSRSGKMHIDNPMRQVSIDVDIPFTYCIRNAKNRWDLIAKALAD